MLSPQSWLHFGHQTHQNHALGLVLATFPTSDSSESCSRLSPGHISYIRLFRSQRNQWFLHRILTIPPQNRALASVLATFPTSDSSESCSRHSPGHISHIRLSRSQRIHWFLPNSDVSQHNWKHCLWYSCRSAGVEFVLFSQSHSDSQWQSQWQHQSQSQSQWHCH